MLDEQFDYPLLSSLAYSQSFCEPVVGVGNFLYKYTFEPASYLASFNMV